MNADHLANWFVTAGLTPPAFLTQQSADSAPAIPPLLEGEIKFKPQSTSASVPKPCEAPIVTPGVISVRFMTQCHKQIESIGAYRYAELCLILGVVFQLGADLISWKPGATQQSANNVTACCSELPAAISTAIDSGLPVLVHDVELAQQLWKRCNWPSPVRWIDIKAIAQAHNVPGQLDLATRSLSKAPSTPSQFSIDPVVKAVREIRQINFIANAIGLVFPNTDEAEGQIDFNTHLKINQRGPYIDRELALGAWRIYDSLRARISSEIEHVTGGAISLTVLHNTQKPNENHRGLLGKLRDLYGVTLPDCTDESIRSYLEKPAGIPIVQRILKARLLVASSSISQFEFLLKRASKNGRVEGLLDFCKAVTGRFSSPAHNIPNPSPGIDVPAVIAAVKMGDKLLLRTAIGARHTVADAMSSCVRAAFTSPPGRRQLVLDLPQIEARAIEFLAGDEQQLDVFRKFDRGEGPDPYCVEAAPFRGRDVVKNRSDEDNSWRDFG